MTQADIDFGDREAAGDYYSLKMLFFVLRAGLIA
jgi:hypothetical protein